MTMERNLNERKRGIRDVCKEDGRGFGTIVILLLCHSDFISLLQIPQTLPLILLATFFTQKNIYLWLVLSQLILLLFSQCFPENHKLFITTDQFLTYRLSINQHSDFDPNLKVLSSPWIAMFDSTIARPWQIYVTLVYPKITSTAVYIQCELNKINIIM